MLSLCHQPYELDAIKLRYNLCPLSLDSSLKSVGVTEWSIIDVEVTGELCPPSPIERKEGLECKANYLMAFDKQEKPTFRTGELQNVTDLLVPLRRGGALV